ncbi:MAG: hypothetical protein ACEPOV_04345 [Hyphomicrobiales bacterium]
MENVLSVIHKMPGRLRCKFSHAPRGVDKIIAQVMEHEGMKDFSFNSILNTSLIEYDPQVVTLHEILIRTATAWSVEHSFEDIKIVDKNPHSYMTPTGILSAIVVAIAGLSRFFPSLASQKAVLNWSAVGSVSTAVLEHASIDIKKKGSVDPEIISLLFLLNSIFKKHFLWPSALAWMVTFGRHIVLSNNESIHLKVSEITNTETKQCYYDVEISKYRSKRAKGYSDVLRLLFERLLSAQMGYANSIFESSRNVAQNHHELLEKMGKATGGIILKTNE